MSRILALIDDSVYAQSVAANAAWLSATTGVSVQLLHVVDHRHATARNLAWAGGMAVGFGPGMVGAAARAADDDLVSMRRRGADLLEQTRIAMLENDAVSVHPALVEGQLEAAVREAARSATLLVMGKRGVGADFARLPLGSNVVRLARSLSVPMVLAARAFRVPSSWLLAFAPGRALATGIERMIAGNLLPLLPCHLVHVGSAQDGLKSQLIQAQSRLNDAGFEACTRISDGAPSQVLPTHMVRQGIDLIALGGLRKSVIRANLLGSTAEELVRACQVPALLLR